VVAEHDAVEETVDLAAIEAIKQLKYRYLRTLDLKRWDEFADVFVPEATGEYAGLSFTGRDDLVAYMREHLGPTLITMHHCHHPEITVHGDTARGTWYLEDKVLAPDFRFVLEGAAFYDDRYLRTPAGWRIAHTGYRRTYELTYSTEDLAGFRLTRGTAYDR
jgi:hypothetical protein